MNRLFPRLFAALALAASALPASAALDQALIARLTGLTGTWNEAEGVYKVTSPRTDLPITVDNWRMPPFMGLTSWASFMAGGKQEVMVMGDLVLFEDEVNPVMSAAFAGGLEVTALHNHFLHDQPKVYFMHIGGEGTLEKLATGVRRALDQVKVVRGAASAPAQSFGGGIPSPSAITGKTIDDLLGTTGQANNGMFKVVIGRTATMECGCTIGKDMGLNTWAAFAGTDANAVVDGDFAVLESELQPVLKSLRAAGINVVAIHHHMTHETPRYLFLHYWGRGPVADLARALRATLAAQQAAK
ncbi:MAG: DUF1259 domain-containing protein [Verrucomicrobia bacterium]|nr:DUF1259 domain-containing protein [Verrucomicrobiota bacterium]